MIHEHFVPFHQRRKWDNEEREKKNGKKANNLDQYRNKSFTLILIVILKAWFF